MGISSSPFLANAVVEHHLRQLVKNSDDEDKTEAADLLLTSMYADDVIASVEDAKQSMAHEVFLKSTLTVFYCDCQQCLVLM